MNIKTSYTITQWLILALAIIAMSSCGTSQQIKTAIDPNEIEVQKAERLVKHGEFESAAGIYWQLAQAESSPKKEQLQLTAAELLIQGGHYQLAQQYLNFINEKNLTFKLIPRKRIAQSRIAISQEQFNKVLVLLPGSLSTRAPEHRIDMLELRAQAFSGMGDTLSSLLIRTELTHYLKEHNQSTHNQNEIWRLLAVARNEELARWAQQENIQLKGWIALAQTKRAPYANIDQLDAALTAWRQDYPNHPASDQLLTSILESYQNYFAIPEKLALLLPLSGRYAQIADVIHAGITSARELHSDGQYTPSIALYDTGDNPADILYHYQRAVDDGADFILGPLKKQAVEILAQQAELPVPILTLNYTSDHSNAPGNMFQFGLLPEDEAIQVAERASLDGHFSAVILSPAGEWGERLANAFRTRFEELNGLILDTQYYIPESTDFSVSLKTALQLDLSEARYRQLRSTLGRNLEFEPRRRQDVDMIFMVASPRTARILRPQINYYYATDLPVYSTSHIYSGIENVSRDRDINGVLYCDIPWLLKDSADNQILHELLELEAPDVYRLLPRFAALGIDAYYLPTKLAELAALPYERYNGLTGKLRVEQDNRVFRELNWAQFQNGRPELIGQFTQSKAPE